MEFSRNEAISSSDLTPKKNTVDMENHVFSKARNKDEYLSFVARLIIHVREMSELKILRESYDICFDGREE